MRNLFTLLTAFAIVACNKAEMPVHPHEFEYEITSREYVTVTIQPVSGDSTITHEFRGTYRYAEQALPGDSIRIEVLAPAHPSIRPVINLRYGGKPYRRVVGDGTGNVNFNTIIRQR